MLRERHRWDPICLPPTGLVRPVPVDPSGRAGPTRGQSVGPHWRRTSPGLFVPASVSPLRPEQRILEQSMRLSGGAVTGWASCRLHGAAFFDGLARDGRTPVPVPLNCGPFHQIRRQPGDDLLRDMLFEDEIEWLHGIPCSVTTRAVFDVMRHAPSQREAVVAMDMVAAAGLTSIRRMRDYVVPGRQARTGVEQCRRALDLADEGSRSPQESRLRLCWQLDARCARPLTNRPVFDLDGRLLGIPDLLDVDAGVVGEYDGEDHRDVIRHSDDVSREARLRDHGLEVVRFTGPDLRDVSLIIDRIHGAYRRAARKSPSDRAWTLQAPPWRSRELSLDERLDRAGWARSSASTG